MSVEPRILPELREGGYVLGHPDMDDELCERFVQTAECIVVSVDYRLAPEHPYPAAIEDCYAGLVWMTEEAALLGIDVDRVAIAGASLAVAAD